jgi:hypothetical protein
MLIEYRAYTLRPGNIPAFWSAQAMRGFDPTTRPIMARLIGYFTEAYGFSDRIVHLWRFDSYEDWITRLHGNDPSREAYFKVVRPLMLAQENSFMLPAPVPALTPLWGNGRDWLPGQPPPLGCLSEACIAMTTVQLLPGTLSSYWQAWRECPAQLAESVIGCFYTLVGQQHQVMYLRYFENTSALQSSHQGEAADQSLAFEKSISSLVVRRKTTLLRPSTNARLSPLFRADAQGRPDPWG